MGDSTYPGPLGRRIDHRGRYRRPALTRTDGLCGASARGGVARQDIQAVGHVRGHATLERAHVRVGGGVAPLAGAEPSFLLWFRTPAAVVSMVLGNAPLRLADAYFRGEVDIEGDLFAALALKDHLKEIKLPLGERWTAFLMALKLRSLNRGLGTADESHAQDESGRSLAYRGAASGHSRDANREAIRFVTTSPTSSTSSGWIAPWFIPAGTSSAPMKQSTTRNRRSSSTFAASCFELGERLFDTGCVGARW